MDRRLPGCYECEAEKLIRVVRRAASRVSVVLAEETEEQDAECLVSGFADEGVRWSDRVTSECVN